ncbi:MAG TPA: M1 family metallopeptidase [Gemmatimonadales bacterium]
MARQLLLLLLLPLAPWWSASGQNPTFTHADTLRGSLTPERVWWDVTFYDLHVTINPSDSTFRGWNAISYRVVGPAREMQIDLQPPLQLDSVVQDKRQLSLRRDGNAFFVKLASGQKRGTVRRVTAYYGGRPHVAQKAPWDGGVVWSQDPAGHLWIATACQGTGASIWWPTKDTQADEPDSQRVVLTVPDSLQAVSNGRLRGVTPAGPGLTAYEWFVTSPINNYDVAVNVGRYARINASYAGEAGNLTLEFWPLPSHRDAAQHQFGQVEPMLACFERWFGPYPWYRDGYQLVETPFLGMEHQSAVAYGNGYENGYKGTDLSGTGWGLTWDFIVIHESAHEWFGNSITSADIADMWVHESFANYAENLFTECEYGPAAGSAYVIGTRKNVKNDRPIIGPYGVNEEGSGDMYYKGGNMLHTIRQIIGNDSTWRSVLRGLNATFQHQIVTGQQIQAYISAHAGVDLSKVFAQYLTTTQIPAFEYRIRGSTLSYRWGQVVPGFDMPLRVALQAGRWTRLRPRESWQTTTLAHPEEFRVDDNFYVVVQRVE